MRLQRLGLFFLVLAGIFIITEFVAVMVTWNMRLDREFNFRNLEARVEFLRDVVLEENVSSDNLSQDDLEIVKVKLTEFGEFHISAHFHLSVAQFERRAHIFMMWYPPNIKAFTKELHAVDFYVEKGSRHLDVVETILRGIVAQ